MITSKFIKIIITLGVSCYLPIISATECASVNFVPNEIDGNVHVLEFIASDGISVPQPKNYRKVTTGGRLYNIEAGEHSLVVRKWLKKEYITNHRNLKRGRAVVKKYEPVTKVIHVKLEDNINYQFAAADGDKIVLINQQEKNNDCDNQIANVKRNIQKTSADELPNDLKRRVYETFGKLGASNNGHFSNIFPIKVSNYFGTVLDREYSQGSTGLLVNAVIPFSLADNLNLKKGDIITALGGEKIKQTKESPAQILNAYLVNTEYGEQINVEIVRTGNKITLVESYVPVVVPEVFYQQSNELHEVINQTQLDGKLQFEFEQLILALTHYYKNQNVNENVHLILHKISKDNIGDVSVNIGLSSIIKAKDNLLSLNRDVKNLDQLFSSHNDKRKRNGQSLYHNAIRKSVN